MINNIRKGDFHLIDSNNDFFAYHKESNQVYAIDLATFNYLNQSFTNFKYDKKIEDDINNSVQSSKGIKKSKQLVLNVFAKKIDTESIVLKEILKRKDNYDRIYITFEVTDELLILIDKIADWFFGDEIIYYVFRATEEKKHLLSYLKQSLKPYQNNKNFTFEIYKIIYSEHLKNDNISKQNFRFSPFLIHEKSNIFISILKQSLFYKSLDMIYNKNYNLRDTDIVTLTDHDFISSVEKNESICNSCWAKKNCYALNLYSIFSSHPLTCSLSDKNCTTIKDFIESVIIKIINQNFVNKTNVIEYYAGNFKISHLNP